MRFGKFTAFTGVFVIALALIWGCGDDKTSAPTVTYGSIDDPEFVPVKTQIDSVLTDFVEDVLLGFDNLYSSRIDTTRIRAELTPPSIVPDPDANPDTLIAIYENGWHFIYATYVGDIYHSRVMDSIRFEVDGMPVEVPSANVDYIHFINNWEFTALNPAVSHIDFDGRNDFNFADLDQSVAIINGTTVNNIEIVYIGVDTTMTNSFNFDFSASDIHMPRTNQGWVATCPVAGTLDMTLTHTYSWTSNVTEGSGATEWTIQVTFNNGTATVTADNATTTWRYQCEICQLPTN